MESDRLNAKFILPAEWEEQSGIQLTWPHAETDWKPCLKEITTTMVSLAKSIVKYEPLLIVTQDIEATKALFTDTERQHISFHTCAIDDTWARDHAFITLCSSHPDVQPRLLDFRFNGWGNKFDASNDNQINRHLYDMHALHGEYEDHNDMVLEGGSIESDGKGTILTTTSCLLAPHRNQPMTHQEIENQLKKRLHAQRILWIEHGELMGDDTDGHIDTTVRFAPNDTLLYIGCDDINDPHYNDFKQMEQQLMTFRTIDNKPYRLLKLPFTKPISYDGERLPATYANFLVINGAVIVPTYQQPELDQQAIATIQTAFPDRDIIPIDARIIIRQHGSIHCLTMQYPAGVLS